MMNSGGSAAISLLCCYLMIINLIAFSVMGVDKSRAQKGHWRIPERTLLFLAIIGGVLGSFLGIKLFHHKTRKRRFSIGLPLILLGWVIMLSLLMYK